MFALDSEVWRASEEKLLPKIGECLIRGVFPSAEHESILLTQLLNLEDISPWFAIGGKGRKYLELIKKFTKRLSGINRTRISIVILYREWKIRNWMPKEPLSANFFWLILGLLIWKSSYKVSIRHLTLYWFFQNRPWFFQKFCFRTLHTLGIWRNTVGQPQVGKFYI